MRLEEINKIKSELFSLFSFFLVNPNYEENKTKAMELEKKYSGLISYSNHSSNELLSEDLLKALGSISLVYEYGIYDESHPVFSKSKIKERIKNIMITLK
jgi:hypothetical protein